MFVKNVFSATYATLLLHTDVLFSVFVQCVVAALSSFLLPLNTAIFRNGLPRAPHLGRPP